MALNRREGSYPSLFALFAPVHVQPGRVKAAPSCNSSAFLFAWRPDGPVQEGQRGLSSKLDSLSRFRCQPLEPTPSKPFLIHHGNAGRGVRRWEIPQFLEVFGIFGIFGVFGANTFSELRSTVAPCAKRRPQVGARERRNAIRWGERPRELQSRRRGNRCRGRQFRIPYSVFRRRGSGFRVPSSGLFGVGRGY